MKEFLKLTSAEMQIMNILWDMPEGGCAWDVIEKWAEPKAADERVQQNSLEVPSGNGLAKGKPAYSTVATMLKILLVKEFLTARKGQGKTLIYSPVISRENYAKLEMAAMKQNLFGGSLRRMVRFFMQEEKLSEEEIKELMTMEPEK